MESPVHFEEVILRVRKAAGVARAGSRIRAQMRLAATVGARRRLYRMDKRDFLWRLEHEAVEVRRWDGDIPPSLRDPARIASDETEAALVHAVRVSYGIGPADAAGEAIRIFGFRRSGPKIVRRFRQVLDELVARGTILREGALLRVPDNAEAGRNVRTARPAAPEHSTTAIRPISAAHARRR